MVNVGLSWSSVVGIALAVSGGGLYFLRTLRPGLARDHDIFFAAVALLCGGILFFQGWRQDPILQFGQFMLAGSAIWFAFEAIRLRSIATEQAKRSTPVVDDNRPVSRVYRAELDELPVMDERPATRRIRGTRDPRSAQADDYGTSDYGDEPKRRPSGRSSGKAARIDSGDRPRKRRPSPPDEPIRGERPEVRNFWDDDDTPEDTSYSGSTYRSSRSSGSTSRPRPRPSSESPERRRRPSAESSDYADYQPINHYSDDEPDNPNNF